MYGFTHYTLTKKETSLKPITECTGSEICQEWLYHMGVPQEEIVELAQSECNTIPVYMPYVTAYFMPRAYKDRPLVVPNGSKNLAFIETLQKQHGILYSLQNIQLEQLWKLFINY